MKKYLIIGKTGVGKSSFINSAFGKYITATSEFEPCTRIVEHFAYNDELGQFCLIDTPGLADNNEEDDTIYLKNIIENVNIDTLYATIYVTRLDDTRFRQEEKQILKLLTKYLGVNLWRDSILVFTFAASIDDANRNNQVNVRYNQISSFVGELLETKYKFTGFKRCLLIDNLIHNWSSSAKPLNELLY